MKGGISAAIIRTRGRVTLIQGCAHDARPRRRSSSPVTPWNLRRIGLTERLRANDPELLQQAAPQLERARDARVRAVARGIQVIAWNDTRFPAALLAISDAPPVIWYRGALDALDAPAVAIVGSRAASAVALETAACLASDLAARGIVVVSGLARGVDSAAHRGALVSGRTIAVLGSDWLACTQRNTRTSPSISHARASRERARADTPPLPFIFHSQSTDSGLSLAVVVIEASKVGTLITAAVCVEQGRE